MTVWTFCPVLYHADPSLVALQETCGNGEGGGEKEWDGDGECEGKMQSPEAIVDITLISRGFMLLSRPPVDPGANEKEEESKECG